MGYALRAQAHLALHNSEAAEADIAVALRLNPDFDLALLLKAYQLLDNGETSAAVQIHSRLEKLDSPYASALATALVFIAMDEANENWDPASEEWQPLSMSVADNFKVTFERRRAHPVQAEYGRRVRVSTPGQAATLVELPMNTGGRTHFNCFWIEAERDAGPWLRLVDHTGEYLLPLKAPSLERICPEGDGLVHVAADSCARSSSNGIVTFAGEASAPPKFYPGVYLGSIDGRSGPLQFRSANDAPQEEIRQGFGGY